MLNGNGSLDTQTHRMIQAWVQDLPTNEMQALLPHLSRQSPACTGLS